MGPFSLYDEATGTRIPFTSLGGYKYAYPVTVERSRWVELILLKHKKELSDKLETLILKLQIKTGQVLGRFHTDLGTEVIKKKMKDFFDQNGTELTTAESGVSQHNGLAERMNRTLQSMTRIMLVQAGAPQILWDEAIKWAAHVYNNTPQKVIEWKTPSEAMYGTTYDPHRLLVWGCNVIVKHLESTQGKFEPRGWKGCFMGYDPQTGAYRVLDLQSGLVVATNDLLAQETDFTHMNSFSQRFQPETSADPGSDRNSFELLQDINDESNDPTFVDDSELESKYDDMNSTGEVVTTNEESTSTIQSPKSSPKSKPVFNQLKE